MKILCFILSLHVLSLSIIPCCWDDDCSDETKTEQTENHSKDHQDDDCDTCSPFLTCGTCTGFVVSKFVFNIKKVHFAKKRSIAVYKSQFVDNFFENIWQPPKIS